MGTKSKEDKENKASSSRAVMTDTSTQAEEGKSSKEKPETRDVDTSSGPSENRAEASTAPPTAAYGPGEHYPGQPAHYHHYHYTPGQMNPYSSSPYSNPYSIPRTPQASPLRPHPQPSTSAPALPTPYDPYAYSPVPHPPPRYAPPGMPGGAPPGGAPAEAPGVHIPPPPPPYAPGMHFYGLKGAPMGLTSLEHVHAYTEQCKRTLNNIVNGDLLSKRDQLLTQMARVQARMEEVRAVRANIEREARDELSCVLDRLHSGEAMKVLALQAHHDDLNRHLHSIQMLLEDVAAFNHSPDGAASVDSLGRFRALYDACTRAGGRAFKEDIDVSADGFEAEARTYSDIRNKYQSLHELLAVKDKMIWQLVEERKQAVVDREDLEARHLAELQAKDRQVEALQRRLLQHGVLPADVEEPPAEEPRIQELDISGK